MNRKRAGRKKLSNRSQAALYTLSVVLVVEILAAPDPLFEDDGDSRASELQGFGAMLIRLRPLDTALPPL